MDSHKIIQQYLVTEKSTIAKESQGKYAFAVDRRATKVQIKQAVEKAFKVEVGAIRTVIMPGKVKRLGRFEGKTSTWKKAIVTLKGDQKIAEFENL